MHGARGGLRQAVQETVQAGGWQRGLRRSELWLMSNGCSKMLDQLPAPCVCLCLPQYLACWSLHKPGWLG